MRTFTKVIFILLQYILILPLHAETTVGIYVAGAGISNYRINTWSKKYFSVLEYLDSLKSSNNNTSQLTFLNSDFAYGIDGDNNKLEVYKVDKKLVYDSSPFVNKLVLEPRLVLIKSYNAHDFDCLYPTYIAAYANELHLICKYSDDMISIAVDPNTGLVGNIIGKVDLGDTDPRKVIITDSGEFAYVLEKKTAKVLALARTPDRQFIKTAEYGSYALNSSDIVFGPYTLSGKQLIYISDKDSLDISVEMLDPKEDGMLSLINYISIVPYKPLRMALVKTSNSGSFLWVTATKATKTSDSSYKQNWLLQYQIGNNGSLSLVSETEMLFAVGNIVYNSAANSLYITYPFNSGFAWCPLNKSRTALLSECEYINSYIHSPVSIATYDFMGFPM